MSVEEFLNEIVEILQTSFTFVRFIPCVCLGVTSHSDTLTLSLSHSLTHNMLNNCCFHVYAQKSLSHSHYLIISLSHSLSVDMLNNFCLHVYAQKSVLIAENCNVFLDHSRCNTLSCYIRVHRAGSQLKISISG